MLIAFYIASSFYGNDMWEATFKQHFNSAFDTFNLTFIHELDKNTYSHFNDDFFVCSDCRPIADSTLYLYRSNMADKVGLKSIRIHDFRHSCASLLINNGANVTLVAKYLGHTKIEETLNTYSHMFSNALDSVVSVIDSLED